MSEWWKCPRCGGLNFTENLCSWPDREFKFRMCTGVKPAHNAKMRVRNLGNGKGFGNMPSSYRPGGSATG